MTAATLTCTVEAIGMPAEDVRTLRLVPRPGSELPAYAPGSHIEVQCGPRRNAYSLIGDPRLPDAYEISVLRCAEGDGGSRYLHDEVSVDSELQISTPRSAFAPPARAARHLLVGGGIGVTPFLSYGRAFARSGVPFELHHVHRVGASPHAGLAELGAGEIVTHAGRAAFLDELPALLDRAPVGTHLSVCGPPSMIDAVLSAAGAAGWPGHRLHSERFVGVDPPAGAPFTARVASTGEVVSVPRGTSLLDALLDAGIGVPHLCRQGVCGECRVGVRSGTPEHHDLHLSETERAAGTVVMACVSRCAAGTLELAL